MKSDNPFTSTEPSGGTAADAPGRTDRVPLEGCIVHLPAEFREVARLANQAGLEGWKFVDAEMKLDVAAALEAIGNAQDIPWISRLEITYERNTVIAGTPFLSWL